MLGHASNQTLHIQNFSVNGQGSSINAMFIQDCNFIQVDKPGVFTKYPGWLVTNQPLPLLQMF